MESISGKNPKIHRGGICPKRDFRTDPFEGRFLGSGLGSVGLESISGKNPKIPRGGICPKRDFRTGPFE